MLMSLPAIPLYGISGRYALCCVNFFCIVIQPLKIKQKQSEKSTRPRKKEELKAMKYDILIHNKKFKDLNPLVCGYERCKSQHYVGPVVHSSYLIHYVISGRGTFISPNGKYEVEKDNIFIIRPNTKVYYMADKTEPWEYAYIAFDGELSLMFESIGKEVIKYSGSYFLEMLDAKNANNTKEEFIAGKLFLAFSEIFDSQIKNNYVDIAKNYIKKSYMYNIKIKNIADNMHINSHHLTRIFKKETGCTMQEYLLNTRIKQAKKLLSKNISITDIAHMVGYDNIYEFSKIFKKKTGKSPSFFKKELIQSGK